MRFELYSFVEIFDVYHYRFETESDNIEELLLYIVTKTAAKYNSKNCEQRWIYMDNDPKGYSFFSLGYSKAPTNEECFDRLFQCKLMRELSVRNIQENSLFFSVRYNLCLETAEKASRHLCKKLFCTST